MGPESLEQAQLRCLRITHAALYGLLGLTVQHLAQIWRRTVIRLVNELIALDYIDAGGS